MGIRRENSYLVHSFIGICPYINLECGPVIGVILYILTNQLQAIMSTTFFINVGVKNTPILCRWEMN